MAAHRSANRRRVAVVLSIGLVLGACGGSAASGSPSTTASSGIAAGSASGDSLTSGLASNLDRLDSYQFIESMPTSTPAGASASPSAGDPQVISGTVINRPIRSIYVNGRPAQFILIGDKAWRSFDGSTWTAGDPTDTFLTDLLPGHDYGIWFDAKSTYFKVVANEVKNGIPCLHYQGDRSLVSLYSGAAGSSAAFEADLWIALSGRYPVSGVYGFTDAAGSQGGSWGFTFDVSRVNDPANQVLAPANVVAIPT